MIENSATMDRPIDRKRGRSKRLLLFGIPLAALLLLALWLAPGIGRWLTTDRSVPLAEIRIGAATRGDLERDVSVQGRVVAAFHPTTFSPAQGIVELRVRAGEVVAEGQVLAVVTSPELDSRLGQEQSLADSLASELERQRIQSKQQVLADRQAVDLAAVELEAAQRAMRRAEESRREGIINAVDFEKAEDDLARADLELAHAREHSTLEGERLDFEVRNRELQLERQRLAVDEARRQVAELTVRSPVAGLVSRIDVQDRDAVALAQPLVTVVDLSAYEIELQVPEAYASEIGPGTPAIVRYGTADFQAEVRSISPEVESGQVRGIVGFTAAIPEGLRQNQRVSTRLILEARPDVVKVPRGPFLEAGGGRHVWVVDSDVARRREIRVGAASVGEVEVVEGLTAGERIVLSDTTRFEDAERVFLRR